MNRRIGWVGLIAFCFLICTVNAQPLADRVPADAVIYVGWAGADSMGPGFEGSHLKAMLESAEIPRIAGEVIPQLRKKFAEKEQEAANVMNLVEPILLPMWKHPSAIYVGPLVWGDGGRPMQAAAVLCDAGADAESMKKQIDQLLEHAHGNSPVPITSRVSGTVVSILVGEIPAMENVFEGKAKAESLASVKHFADAMSKQSSPVLSAYIDAQKVVKTADDAIARQGDGDAAKKWQTVRDALGLPGLNRIALTQGFDGKDWSTQVFMDAPSPRKGLLAALDAQPISDELFRAVPASATVAGVGRADLGALFDAMGNIVRKFDPQAARDWEKGVKQLNDMIGIDLRRDLLAPLGDEWAYYIAPEITGRGPLGAVLMNRLRDSATAEASLEKLKSRANEAIAKNADKEITIRFKETKTGGQKISYLATPFVSPAWTVDGGHLLIGAYPQSVASAMMHTTAKGKTLLDNPDFVSLRRRLGGEKAVSIQFYDLPRSAPTSYQLWMFLASFGKLGDIVGVDTPAMLLPPLQTLTQHLSVAGAASWVDDAGWHFKSLSPFPGSTVLASESGGVMDVQTTALMTSVLLPSLSRAREQANRVKSMNNLRSIGQSAMMYANEHKGKFPDKLSDTLENLHRDAYTNPSSGTVLPPDVQGDDLKAWIDSSSDYVWIGKGLTVRGSANRILAHERVDQSREGVNILFADGHTEWLRMPQALAAIEAKEFDVDAETRRQHELQRHE